LPSLWRMRRVDHTRRDVVLSLLWNWKTVSKRKIVEKVEPVLKQARWSYSRLKDWIATV
jgi:hypothetical protein